MGIFILSELTTSGENKQIIELGLFICDAISYDSKHYLVSFKKNSVNIV